MLRTMVNDVLMFPTFHNAGTCFNREYEWLNSKLLVLREIPRLVHTTQKHQNKLEALKLEDGSKLKVSSITRVIRHVNKG